MKPHEHVWLINNVFMGTMVTWLTNLTSVPMIIMVTFVIVDTKVAMIAKVTWEPQNVFALRI